MAIAAPATPGFRSQVINQILSFQPFAKFAKQQARQMMIKRAASIGVNWLEDAAVLAERNWDDDWAQVHNPDLAYPEYYLRTFHAYDQGNLGWEAATEVEVAAYAVHARIWPDGGIEGDVRLRQSYHDCLRSQIAQPPHAILDLGCSVGMSTFALQKIYPEANLTGLDLSPYFLAIAHYQGQQRQSKIKWVQAAAEATGLPEASFDLVSLCLVCHELPSVITAQIFAEARRLLRPGGHLAVMDMNPQSAVYAKMPPYVLTLLKSTEPYLDEYFSLDLAAAIARAGFSQPSFSCNTPRHRTLIAQAC
ncbi:MAG: class I SAM-dependent methyltransferase [Aphanocapsa sp. GSE-SYN-MK-11-07L]|jgi:ubiquinone/menaquinone biosynthesis C-methylase UbiE|nr:class I SAM-dependent methyltransferase [Aphanocapsa sp. GSE-SYN-MK-11-07L]